jgi:pectate lyase
LVGLAGTWISGGIEFNWPQHHRPSTFQPVDYTIVENEDGSKTVWINEVEIMFRTNHQGAQEHKNMIDILKQSRWVTINSIVPLV